MRKISPDQLDGVLPQTQCGLCGYGGCMPYAEALAYENAPINLCPPGGIKTLLKLGELLKEDPTPYIANMTKLEKPPVLAYIREAECIGCTKCINVCPVDAIIGSAKQMHTVITSECTGCELCIPSCPVDCIDLVKSDQKKENRSAHYKKRFINRQSRLKKEILIKNSMKNLMQAMNEKKNYIKSAIARSKAKKLSLEDLNK